MIYHVFESVCGVKTEWNLGFWVICRSRGVLGGPDILLVIEIREEKNLNPFLKIENLKRKYSIPRIRTMLNGIIIWREGSQWDMQNGNNFEKMKSYFPYSTTSSKKLIYSFKKKENKKSSSWRENENCMYFFLSFFI